MTKKSPSSQVGLESPKQKLVNKSSKLQEVSITETTETQATPDVEKKHLSVRKHWYEKVWLWILIGSFAVAMMVLVVVFPHIARGDVYVSVIDNNGVVVEGARIVVDGDARITDISGGSLYTKVPIGAKLTVEKNRFQKVESQLSIQPFGSYNHIVKLQPLTESSLTGVVDIPEGIEPETIEIIVQDTRQELASDGTFVLENMSPGETQISIQGPLIQQVTQTITILPGDNTLAPFQVARAQALSINITNWANGNPLTNAQVRIGDQTLVTNTSGIVELIDFNTYFEKELRVEMAGFRTESQPILTDTISVELVPEGRIFYTSDRDGRNTVYSSDYDGKNEKKITDGVGSLENVSIQGDTLYFVSDRDGVRNDFESVPQVFSVPIQGGTTRRVSNLRGYTSTEDAYISEKLQLGAGKIIYNTNNAYQIKENISKIEVVNFDGTNRQLIRTRNLGEKVEEPVLDSVLSPDGQKIAYFVRRSNINAGYQFENMRIFIVDTNGENPREILVTEEEFSSIGFVGFSRNSRYFIYQISDENRNVSLHIYDYLTGKTRVSVDSGFAGRFDTGYMAGVIPDFDFSHLHTHFIYIAERDGQKDIFSLDLASLETQRLTQLGKVEAFHIEPNGLIYLQNDNQPMVLRAGDAKPVNIQTNFEYWSFTGCPCGL